MNIKDYLSDIEQLCEFIPFFKDVDPDTVCTWIYKDRDCNIIFPYPVYSDDFMNFINIYYKTNLIHSNYNDELDKRIPNWQEIDINEVIMTADFELLVIILTKAIRVERFHDGAWESAVEGGIFLNILNRLKSLSRSIR